FYLPYILFLLMTGRLYKSRYVTFLRGKNVRIVRQGAGPTHADGDWFEGGPVLDISIYQRNLNVIVPQK
ncbi:MAG: hypothetical protein II364_01595, partial [Bacteroidales bacterium]|nr:hypothetical protein [Bacteroidales bacterium]